MLARTRVASGRMIGGMRVLLLSLPNGTRKIVDLPSGSDPDIIAEGHGASIFEMCDSRKEAESRIAKDPNGNVSPSEKPSQKVSDA